MKKATSMISGLAGCALLGASIGCFVGMVKTQKTPFTKTAGCAIKSVGSMIEKLHF